MTSLRRCSLALLLWHCCCCCAPSGVWWLSGGTRVVVIVIATRPAGLRHSVFGDAALCVVGGVAKEALGLAHHGEKLTKEDDNTTKGGSSVVVVEAFFLFLSITHPVLAAGVRVRACVCSSGLLRCTALY